MITITRSLWVGKVFALGPCLAQLLGVVKNDHWKLIIFSILDVEFYYASRGRMIRPSKPAVFGEACSFKWDQEPNSIGPPVFQNFTMPKDCFQNFSIVSPLGDWNSDLKAF